MVKTECRRVKGSENLRQKLLLSTLSGTALLVEDIRADHTWPGLRPHEVSFLRLLEKISDDCEVEINETGKKLKYRPGIVMGGRGLVHDCGLNRSIGYFFEPLVLIALFAKKAIKTTGFDLLGSIGSKSFRFMAQETGIESSAMSSNNTGNPSPTDRIQGRAGLLMTYPSLADMNYGVWAARMKLTMKALRVWEAVEGSVVVSAEIDQGAHVVISQTIPDAIMMAIADRGTAKEAWDVIKEMHVGEERVKNVNVIVLRRELDMMFMSEDETIADFSRKMTNLVPPTEDFASFIYIGTL